MIIWDNFYIERSRLELESHAKLILSHIQEHLIDENESNFSSDTIDAFTRYMIGASDVRVTMISKSGKVIADSQVDHGKMDNLGDSPEILTALNGGSGYSLRLSKTLGIEMMYVAMPLEIDDEIIGFVRTSLPLTTIREGNQKILVNLIIIIVMLSIFIITISLLITRYLTRHLGEMKTVAEKLALGVYYKKLEIPKSSELASLAIALNKMAYELTEHIDSITESNYSLEEEIKVKKDNEKKLINANKALEEIAVMDAVTGIANRHKFNNTLSAEWKRMHRENSCLALILVDVDCFKLYNDYYGHQKGDDCLFQIAQTISTVCDRSGDLVARYGGEEFAILLPNTDMAGALSLAEEIRRYIDELRIPHEKSLVSDHITVSAGIESLVPDLDLPMETIIATADKALYIAKSTGRNRVCLMGNANQGAITG